MRILFIADVVGSPGREAVAAVLPRLIEGRSVDFCVVNGENSAGGSGLTPEIAAVLFRAGADVVTTGDHVFRRKEVVALLEGEPRVLRACNLSPAAPGRGFGVFPSRGGGSVGVVTVLGQRYMEPVDSIYRSAEEALGRVAPHTALRFVEVHAEATSEKMTLAHLLDGRVTAVVGTHTHVATADERILPGGTAYLTDAGMTGPHRSILGRRIEDVLKSVTSGVPVKYGIAEEDVRLQGVLVEADPATGKALAVERVEEE